MRVIAGALGLAVAAGLATADLTNADIETNDAGLFGPINDWGPNGSYADHATFAKAGNAGLGNFFGYMSTNNGETVGQQSSRLFKAGVSYTFTSYAQGGGNDVGTILYQIGYEDGAGDFVTLAEAAYIAGADWQEMGGVSITINSGDAAIGSRVWVRLGAVDDGRNPDDTWFDSFSLKIVPAPGSMALLALGGIAAGRRRR